MSTTPAADDQLDDLELALRMMDGDEPALMLVLRHYGPRVMGALRSKYGSVPDYVLEDACNRAAYTIWKKAGDFEPEKGTLHGWFYSCAHTEVSNVLREGTKKKMTLLSLETLSHSIADPASNPGHQNAPLAPEKRRLYDDLWQAIGQLPHNERTITEMDVYSGDIADTDLLIDLLGTTKGSIYASRSKARAKLREAMKKKGHFQ